MLRAMAAHRESADVQESGTMALQYLYKKAGVSKKTPKTVRV
jgi:hypothetical protein